eukprot:6192158-Pleurochrysis_carterae.AAC.2
MGEDERFDRWRLPEELQMMVELAAILAHQSVACLRRFEPYDAVLRPFVRLAGLRALLPSDDLGTFGCVFGFISPSPFGGRKC